jgi:hypothetical protein
MYLVGRMQFLNVKRGCNTEIVRITMCLLLSSLVRRVFTSRPETNHIYMVHNVAAILLLHFMARVMLFPMINDLYSHLYCYISTSPSMCPLASLVFCSSLMSCLLSQPSYVLIQ